VGITARQDAMTNYFLGADLGGTKTHVLIADQDGRVLGFGEAGPGNPEGVGYDGMFAVLELGTRQALQRAGLSIDQVCGAGFGVGGFDWDSQRGDMCATIDRLGLQAPYALVNDTILGLVAGAEEGWGVAVVSGTGCNCRGWDSTHQREGRVSGYGAIMGEGAGASELVIRAMQLVNYAWIGRGPATALGDALARQVGAASLEDLIEGYTEERYPIGAAAAPLIFQVAEQGDAVARGLIDWAGCELGEMVNAVVRQLEFEALAFDVVMMGSMFEGGERLIAPMRSTIYRAAPQARLVRLSAPPVAGAVLLGMTEGGLPMGPEVRRAVIQNLRLLRDAA